MNNEDKIAFLTDEIESLKASVKWWQKNSDEWKAMYYEMKQQRDECWGKESSA